MVYYCEEFLDKNNDTLNADFETALLASSKPLVVEVCKPEEEAPGAATKRKKGGSFSSVGAKFVKSLKELMTELNASQAHFVRCVKPNQKLTPQELPLTRTRTRTRTRTPTLTRTLTLTLTP